MVNWQVTATTIYCDSVDDEVTVQVFKDWSVRCSGYDKLYQPTKEMLKLIKVKSKLGKRQLKCEGLGCRWVKQYKDKLLADESKASFLD